MHKWPRQGFTQAWLVIRCGSCSYASCCPAASALSNKKRNALFEKLRAACSNYVLGDLATELAELIGQGCDVGPDEDDADEADATDRVPHSVSE